MEPVMTKTVLISTTENTAPQSNPAALNDIFQKLSHTTQMLENWLTTASISPNSTEPNDITGCEKTNSTAQRNFLDLESQIHKLQETSAAAEEQSRQIAETTQLQIAELQHENATLHHQYEAALATNQQIAAEKEGLQQEAALLQSQHAAALTEIQHVTAVSHEHQRRLQERIQADRQAATQITHQQLTSLRNTIAELRQQTSTQLQAFQSELETCKTHLNGLGEHTDPDNADRIMELAKLEAFDQWIQKNPRTEEQLTAQTMLQRVTTKLNHMFRNLKTELYQAITERDELQARVEEHLETRSASTTMGNTPRIRQN